MRGLHTSRLDSCLSDAERVGGSYPGPFPDTYDLYGLAIVQAVALGLKSIVAENNLDNAVEAIAKSASDELSAIFNEPGFLPSKLFLECRWDMDNGRGVLHELPLWNEVEPLLQDQWAKAKQGWDRDGVTSQFWIDWYDAALAGLPLLSDWRRHRALLDDVLLSSDRSEADDTFQRNERVSRAYDKHKALQIAELLLEDARRMKETAAVRARRLHNNPPEPLDVELDASASVQLRGEEAEAAVVALARQLSSSKPNGEEIERNASLLRDATLAVLKWLGAKADRAVDALIDWGVPISAVWMVANQERILLLAEMAIQFARSLV